MGNLVKSVMHVSNTPTIPAIEHGRDRPRFSVMLPTFEPGEMLQRSLESVLTQALPPDQMQIGVVDDGSQRADIAKLVRAIDPGGRVDIHVGGPHLGIGGNWNRAISLARGHLIHLLHQDDMVLPGFYDRIARAFLEAPLLGMAFCRTRIVDTNGNVVKTSSRLRWRAGVLTNWLPQIALRQRIQTPSVVIARSIYEALGGYRDELPHALDWEMWVRIAARYQVWYEPAPLAIFRRHAASETSRLSTKGAIWSDLVRAIRLNADSLPPAHQRQGSSRSARWYAGSALREAAKQAGRHEHPAARATLGEARPLFQMISDPRQRLVVERRAAALERRLNAAMRSA